MIRSDYLVVGAGASALAFVDTVFKQTDATFTIVDKGDLPGGHWNDAYPFVQLHQPAHMYGVASMPFGNLGIDRVGSNRGLTPLATGAQVAGHLHTFMTDTLLQSGRVNYLPLTEYTGDGECVSLLTGEVTRVEAPVTVDATLMQATIPLTHERAFRVAADATCIPPNQLAHRAPHHRHFAVLGGGKTALDTVNWLLANGVDPDRITWVRPREAWLLNRATVQPGPFHMSETARFQAAQYGILGEATSLDEVALRLEEAGVWVRLDESVTPSMMHGATVSMHELEQARRIQDVVQGSRVTAVEADRLVLQGGEHPLPVGTLVVDCTASGLGGNVGVRQPVFSEGRIALQMLRQWQPTFSSALIGHIEVNVADPAERAAMTKPAPMTDTVADYAVGMLTTIANQAAWLGSPVVREWLMGCRLDLTASWGHPDVDPQEREAAVTRLRANVAGAAQNLARLTAIDTRPLADAVPTS